MTFPLSRFVALELSAAKARQGLTNEQLAAKVNLSASTVTKTLNNSQLIDVDRVALLAEALDTSATVVFVGALTRYEQQKRSPHSKE